VVEILECLLVQNMYEHNYTILVSVAADCLHIIQLMPLPYQNPSICVLIQMQTGFTFLVPADPEAVKRV